MMHDKDIGIGIPFTFLQEKYLIADEIQNRKKISERMLTGTTEMSTILSSSLTCSHHAFVMFSIKDRSLGQEHQFKISYF